MSLTTTDERYLRTALSTEGSTVLRIQDATFKVTASKWPRGEWRVRILDHRTGDMVYSDMDVVEKMLPRAMQRIAAHLGARLLAAGGAA